MTTTTIARRPDRGVVAVMGEDAATFLHGVVTNTIKTLAPGEARLGALLTPQGKVLFDFLATPVEGGFLFEVARGEAAAFAKRLGFYKLRAKVTVADRSDDFAVFLAWGGPAPTIEGAVAFADPRLAVLGTHLLVPAAVADTVATTASPADWHALRIEHGVPESGLDFALGDVFPHDVDMDDLDGVDFKKGCFVGQEVVSRMKHRGTARKRVVIARALEARPAWPDLGTEITCGDKTIGAIGSSHGPLALALVRTDRAKAAIDSGDAIEVGGVTIGLDLPEFASFDWPHETAE
ncbi:YgfZ/GcvT domain-containing protein [Pinisolibacter aquiterrae]|uniref:CAF17-like 4Fe-4S cluster assembly/insertion protein YgfZ n=1 Tax=Pinisolibacter aquiterrae TaxID=2815579 RepID=UPI001C3E553F|nr:folate-binding protein [Pinisolibacter aquiterrae]MBV5262578.1 folate-binding protein YgfZ [Pinisolibacter aquiterrae]MCC8237030.1 folate-binding protein [Pinisolibacter aquiterrae]